MRYLRDVATLTLEPDLCIGCGMCPRVCPHGVMAVEEGLARILDRDLCMECGACARNCPTEAVKVQRGVGCAHAVISSLLGLKDSCCSLDGYGPDEPACGCGGSEEPSSSGKGGLKGCC